MRTRRRAAPGRSAPRPAARCRRRGRAPAPAPATIASASLSARIARQATTARPAASAGSASASAAAPSGLWAASMKAGGSSAICSRRPGIGQRRGDLGDPVGVELAEKRLRGGERQGEVASLEAARRPAGAAPRPGSSGARTSRAPRSAAVRSASAATSALTPGPAPGSSESRSTASFSAAISSLGLAQPLGVVEADRGQHRHPRGDRVGRVEPARRARPRSPRPRPGPRRGRRR